MIPDNTKPYVPIQRWKLGFGGVKLDNGGDLVFYADHKEHMQALREKHLDDLAEDSAKIRADCMKELTTVTTERNAALALAENMKLVAWGLMAKDRCGHHPHIDNDGSILDVYDYEYFDGRVEKVHLQALVFGEPLNMGARIALKSAMEGEKERDWLTRRGNHNE
jgi:hypothetical protein